MTVFGLEYQGERLVTFRCDSLTQYRSWTEAIQKVRSEKVGQKNIEMNIEVKEHEQEQEQVYHRKEARSQVSIGDGSYRMSEVW